MEFIADVPSQLSFSALVVLISGYVLDRFGRRFCIIYCSIFHGLVLLAVGICGFFTNQSEAAGWALAVLLNLAISTGQLAQNGPGYVLMYVAIVIEGNVNADP